MRVEILIALLKKCPMDAIVRVRDHRDIDHVRMVTDMESDKTIVYID